MTSKHERRAQRRAKRAKRTAERLEKFGQILDDAAAHADDEIEEKPERPASERAAAQVALGATKRFRKKLANE